MKKLNIEKDWITVSGLRAVVLMGNTDQHRCGYVEVPLGHPLHGVGYSEPCAAIQAPGMNEPVGKRGTLTLVCAALSSDTDRLTAPDVAFDVHGSISYAKGDGKYPVESNGWWFGFDCAHYGDASSDAYYERMKAQYPDSPYMWSRDVGSVHRTLDYCIAECEALAQQIVERTKP